MTPTRRVAFLSMDSLDEFCCDDDLALPAFQAIGLAVETVSWRSDTDWSRFDLIVVRSTWDYFLAPDAFSRTLENIESTTGRLANPLPVLKWNIDKRYLRDLADRGVAIVPTRWGSGLDAAELDALSQIYGDDGFVIKPTISGGSHRTFRLPDETIEIGSVVAAHESSRWMAQPFLPAVQADGEYSLFYFAGKYSHAVRKTAVNGDFRVQEEFGGHIGAVDPSPALHEAASRALAAVDGHTLYARVDLVPSDNRYLVMEIELIEPSLYLRFAPHAPARFAQACRDWIDGY